jgi:hypothetical protein
MSCIPGGSCSGSLSFGVAGAALGRSKYVVYSGQGQTIIRSRGGRTWPLEVCRVFRAGIALVAYYSEPRGAHLAIRRMSCIPGRDCTVSLSFGDAGAALGRSKYVVYSGQGCKCQPIIRSRGGRTWQLEVCRVLRARIAAVAYHSEPRGPHLTVRAISCLPGKDCTVSPIIRGRGLCTLFVVVVVSLHSRANGQLHGYTSDKKRLETLSHQLVDLYFLPAALIFRFG